MHARTPSIGNDAVFCGVTCGLEIATEGTRSTDARVLLSSWLAGQLALLHAGVPEARYVHCGAGTRGCYCKPYYASTHRISLHGTKTGRCKVRTLLMGISLRKQEVHDKWNFHWLLTFAFRSLRDPHTGVDVRIQEIPLRRMWLSRAEPSRADRTGNIFHRSPLQQT